MSDNQTWWTPDAPQGANGAGGESAGNAAGQRPGPGPAHPGYAQQRQTPAWQHQQPAGQHQPLTGYGQQPGWAPPPKPGLVPLRPLGFGTLLGAPFQALRQNPKITVGAALILQGVPSIFVAVLTSAIVSLLLTRVTTANAQDQSAITAGAIGGSILLGVLSIVVSTVFSALLQGIVVTEVSRETLGEKLSFGSLWRMVRGRMAALIGWAFLFALAWLLALVTVIVVALASLGGPAGIIGAVLVGIAGGFGLIAVAIWINTKLAIVPSAIVIERLPIGAAVSRSWRLTTGYFWRTLGVIVLIAVIIGTVTQIITTPFSLIGMMAGGIFAPTALSGQDQSGVDQFLAVQLGTNILASIVGAVVGAIGSVVQTAAVALLYIDLRMRKEGLDLHLVRFVEARQAGQDLPDPYTQPAPTAPVWPAPAPPDAPWPGV
ncbi:hypothetical protein [Leifsonia xyli]|uniref:hypothetical protein n=1 Tax=Leifsonia xyli TaxID=1575 RepID=UPI0002F7D0A1|nr:hypothetical protein [Leifsonia xyli]